MNDRGEFLIAKQSFPPNTILQPGQSIKLEVTIPLNDDGLRVLTNAIGDYSTSANAGAAVTDDLTAVAGGEPKPRWDRPEPKAI